jgi:hypothetical protein
MKQKQLNKPKNGVLRKVRTALLAVPLVTGLMLGGKAEAKDKKPKGEPIPATSIFSGKIKKCKGLIGEAIIVSPKDKCKFSVKKGDHIFKLEFLTEVAGHFGIKVLDVDRKGVTFELQMELYMSEHATGKFRINYDGTMSPWLKKRSLGIKKTLKVERTKNPKVAKVTLNKDFSTSDFFGNQ